MNKHEPTQQQEPHRQQVLSCDSCSHAEKTNSKTYPVKCLISKPIPMMVHEYCISWFGYVGCSSHSSATSPAALPDVKELFRKEIAKWKDEDPLFMAYVYGQEAGAKRERVLVLNHLFKDRVIQGGRADGFEFYIIGVKTVESLRTKEQP